MLEDLETEIRETLIVSSTGELEIHRILSRLRRGLHIVNALNL
jgi:hypothetical protein